MKKIKHLYYKILLLGQSLAHTPSLRHKKTFRYGGYAISEAWAFAFIS